MYTVGFWKDLGERTVATFAQALVAIFTVLAVEGGGLLDVDWVLAFSVSGLAALLAVLKGLAASAGGNVETGASFGTAIPKGSVAAVETEHAGAYHAEEAAPYPDGTPVDVTLDHDQVDGEYGNLVDPNLLDHDRK